MPWDLREDDDEFMTVAEVADMERLAWQEHNPIFAHLCGAWIDLRNRGVSEALPPDPRLLLTGFYEREAHRQARGDKGWQGYRIQRALTQQLDTEAADRWESTAEEGNAEHRARRLSNKQKGSAHWMTAKPTRPETTMTDPEWVCAMQQRAGRSPLEELREGSKCICGACLTHAHAMSCRLLRHRLIKHDTVVHRVAQWLRERGIYCVKELVVLSTGLARIDILVKHTGIVYWLDVSITEPGTQTGIAAGAAEEALAAAGARERSKRLEWQKRAEADGKVVTVVPCVMETTGALGTEFLEFIKNMERAARGSGALRAAGLVQQLSVIVHQCNAAMLEEAIRRRR